MDVGTTEGGAVTAPGARLDAPFAANTPAAAAPPVATATMAIHFALPLPVPIDDDFTGASEMYCEQTAPARDSPFAAVMRI